MLTGNIEYLKKYLKAFAQVANIFEAAGAEIDDLGMALSLANCNDGDVPAQISTMFIMELADNTRFRPPAVPAATAAAAAASAAAVPFVAALPEPIPAYIVAARRRIVDMRTSRTMQRGAILARTAKSLLGQWRWIQRTPDSILPYRHVHGDTAQHTDINAFDRWVRDGGIRPAGTTALNCRDAVLVTAVAAGLLTQGQLHAAYGVAEANVRKRLDSVLLKFHHAPRENWPDQQWLRGVEAHLHHVKKVDRLLTKYDSAVPVSLGHGLIPQPGDLVFVRGNPPAHVCVSLGRSRVNERAVDEVASLWHHNNGTFTRARLIDMARSENDLVYVPCPF
ncbi:hypothetical protein [Reyranella sp. CPCC 100927]|uniref:hypothetical protein n=1 Tax=Reyranella sp. CPCC 100927 TaxID=2599616 RepID=UPI0011B6437B|nr:hypothetical protein [Reyranella sp. CPCC 100927]TWT01999.1 hypothetical protein FQU96_30945 [Reyranella sp. CPCC 100927]